MKALDPELLKILACPICKTELAAVVSGESARTPAGSAHSAGGPIELSCAKCSRRYPVVDGIPDMIPGPKP